MEQNFSENQESKLSNEYVDGLEQQIISYQMGIDFFKETLRILDLYLKGHDIVFNGGVFNVIDNPLDSLEGDLRNLELKIDNVIYTTFHE